MPDLFEVGSGGVLYKPKSDGYFDGYNTLQGVRTMDSVTGNFTTPDAGVGEISNPSTKKPFIWDANNPEIYSDPSGFDQRETQSALEAELLGGELAPMVRAQIQQQLRGLAKGLDVKIANLDKSLFRGGDQEVPGGTAGAIRQELRTGQMVGGKFQLTKVANSLRNIQRLLQDPDLTPEQREYLLKQQSDLQDAFGKYHPDDFLNQNSPPSGGGISSATGNCQAHQGLPFR